jgi:hypothetical protein
VSGFLFARRRISSHYGLIAFFFPAVTGAYYFAYEARPYGLILGFCGLAALCWQAAAEQRSRAASLVGLAVFLGCAMNCHYYAVLLLLPFTLAEFARYAQRRKFDLAMYAAILLPAFSLILSLPLIRAASRYSAAFWAKPHWASIFGFYEELLQPTSLALILLLLAAGLFAWRKPDSEGHRPSYFPMQDMALAIGFLLIPAAAVTFAELCTGAYTSRYAIYAVFGLSILLADTLARLGQGRADSGLALGVLLMLCFVVIGVRNWRSVGWNADEQAETFKFLTASDRQLPLAIDSPHQFFEQSHQAALHGQGHFIYLASTPLALKYTDTDDVERGLIALSNYAPLDVRNYSSFTAGHSQFLVYETPSAFGWLLKDLIRNGRPVSVRARNGTAVLYLVGPRKVQCRLTVSPSR